MSVKKQIACVVALFACLHASIASAAYVVLSSSLSVFAADDGTGGVSEDVINATVSFPFLATHTVTNVGGSSASATYDFDLTGDGGAVFLIDFDLARTGRNGSTGGLNSHVFFEVTEESAFNANGFMAMVGNGGLFMDVKLRDYGVSPELVYQNLQASLETQDEVFTLGAMGGDYTNALIGELPAVLIPGHQYLIQWNVDVHTFNPDDGATATGHLEFGFAAGAPPGPNPVPEASSLVVWSMLSMVGIGYGWWRKRRSN